MKSFQPPTRSPNPSSRDDITLPRFQSNQSFWKSPVVLSITALGVALTVAAFVTSLSARSVMHIRGDDVSASAKVYAVERQQHCQLSVQQYQPGDTVIHIPFANQPEVTLETTLSNSLSLLGQCKAINSAPPNTEQQPGTSLILELKRIETVIRAQRGLGNDDPVVVSLTLHAIEPGQGLPDPNDFPLVRRLVKSIVDDRGIVVIIGPTGALQQQLETALEDIPHQRICPAGSLTTCVEWAFTEGRRL